MTRVQTLKDLIGIEDVKLGFYQETQAKVEELKAFNRKLEEKQHEIQAILDGIVDVMVVISEDMSVMTVNHVYYDLFRDAAPEGKGCAEVLQCSESLCKCCPVAEAFRNNEIYRSQAVLPCRDRMRTFEIVASPLTHSDGSPDRVLLFMRDVTMEKEYQAQFMQAEKMATVGVLAAGVAHEVNNPLTAIRGFTEGIERRLPAIEGKVGEEVLEDISEYVQTILKECKRCQDIVQNLLTFSRPRNAPFQQVHLKSLVLDCLKVLHYRLKKCPNVLVNLDFGAEDAVILGDEAQLKQVFLNLLTNALDAVGAAGTIDIRLTEDSPAVFSLRVDDTGHGVDAENLNRIFDPFFTTKPVGQGTGIGLSTCFNIVKAHGGEIMACSEPENGSSFCVKLPKAGMQAHD